MLKIAFPGLQISKFSGEACPQTPPRGSYLITPLNKYSCQYEHPSKNLSYAPDTEYPNPKNQEKLDTFIYIRIGTKKNTIYVRIYEN